MKKEIPVAWGIVAVVVLVVVVVFVYWRGTVGEEKSRPPVMTGPIELPASQQGTRLGNQRLGTTYPANPNEAAQQGPGAARHGVVQQGMQGSPAGPAPNAPAPPGGVQFAPPPGGLAQPPG